MKFIGLLSWVAVLIIMGFASACFASQPHSSNATLVDLDLKNVTVEQGINALFAGTGYKYKIEPGVSGKIVELRLKGITFEQALSLFIDVAGLTYTKSDGIYVISPVPSTQAGSATRVIVQQGNAKYAQKPAQGASVPYPQQQNQYQPTQSTNTQAAPQPDAPSQQVIVNQQAPVIYSQPGYNPGNYGYPSMYRAGNMGVINGGWGPFAVFGGIPYVASFGLGPVPPPGWVSPDVLRFLRGAKALIPGMNIYGPTY